MTLGPWDRRRCLASGLALLPAALVAPHVARAATRTLKIGHTNPESSVFQAAAVGMAEALAQASGGRIALEIFPNAVLGSEVQMLNNVAGGSLDMTLAPPGTISTLVPEIGLLEMPYLFADTAQARARLDGALGQHCAELLAPKDIRTLAWAEIGQRHITANRPIRQPSDLRGLKLRVPVSPALLEGFRAMGAEAAILPITQLPEALRTGRFEAQENPISVIVSNNFQRFQSHLSLTRHVYASLAFLISADSWSDLDADGQAMLQAAARQGALASRAFADRIESSGIATLRDAGMTVVAEVDGAAFQRAAAAAQAPLDAAFGAAPVTRIRRLAA